MIWMNIFRIMKCYKYFNGNCINNHNGIVQGVSLAQAREKGQLVFLEGLKDSVGVIIQEESRQSTQPLSYLRHV